MEMSELYRLFVRHPHITTDSRSCPAGSIFFALKGERFDGNRYAAAALEAGCAYAVVDNAKYAVCERTILVDDTLKTLQRLAHLHRKTLGIPLIAVTGTNGKTTTKELLAAVLSAKYNLLYTEGNLNNHIGVPLTLLRLTREHEMAVVEMGASHPGDIRELVEIAAPDYGIITNVGRAHLQGFGSFEGVVRTKGELYDYLRSTGGKIFIHGEDKDLLSIACGIEQITYGNDDAEDFVSGHAIGCDPFLIFSWKQQGETHTVETRLIGAYNLSNTLAAVAVGCYFDVPAESICRAIASYLPTNNRSQLKETARNTLLIDAYNANPSSMKAALDNFAALSAYPKAVILGDMRELGEGSDSLHAEVVEAVRTCHFDRVILCGEHFCRTGEGFTTFPSTDSLLASLREQPLEGYYILIKGSHSMSLEKTIDVL